MQSLARPTSTPDTHPSPTRAEQATTILERIHALITADLDQDPAVPEGVVEARLEVQLQRLERLLEAGPIHLGRAWASDVLTGAGAPAIVRSVTDRRGIRAAFDTALGWTLNRSTAQAAPHLDLRFPHVMALRGIARGHHAHHDGARATVGNLTSPAYVLQDLIQAGYLARDFTGAHYLTPSGRDLTRRLFPT